MHKHYIYNIYIYHSSYICISIIYIIYIYTLTETRQLLHGLLNFLTLFFTIFFVNRGTAIANTLTFCKLTTKTITFATDLDISYNQFSPSHPITAFLQTTSSANLFSSSDPPTSPTKSSPIKTEH